MTAENLICLASGVALGIAGVFFVVIIRAKFRANRLRHLPRGIVLFRP